MILRRSRTICTAIPAALLLLLLLLLPSVAHAEPVPPSRDDEGGATVTATNGPKVGDTLNQFEQSYPVVTDYPGSSEPIVTAFNMGSAYLLVHVDQRQTGFVDGVTIIPQPSASAWSSTDLPMLEQIALSFLPSDATHSTTRPFESGRQEVWNSASLAQRFPSTYFQDGAGHIVTVGDVTVNFVYPLNYPSSPDPTVAAPTTNHTHIEAVTVAVGDIAWFYQLADSLGDGASSPIPSLNEVLCRMALRTFLKRQEEWLGGAIPLAF